MPRIMQGTNGERQIDSANAPTFSPATAASRDARAARGEVGRLLVAAVGAHEPATDRQAQPGPPVAAARAKAAPAT
jgi:hypothetical protein